ADRPELSPEIAGVHQLVEVSIPGGLLGVARKPDAPIIRCTADGDVHWCVPKCSSVAGFEPLPQSNLPRFDVNRSWFSGRWRGASLCVILRRTRPRATGSSSGLGCTMPWPKMDGSRFISQKPRFWWQPCEPNGALSIRADRGG